MKTVFADTNYWIAIVVRSDQFHNKATQASNALRAVTLVTTDEILVEFLNYLRNMGSATRITGVKMARAILMNPNVQVVPQTRDSFIEGLKLYEQRDDKEYSLTDCISLNVMHQQDITEVLTHDQHFSQEGKMLLL